MKKIVTFCLLIFLAIVFIQNKVSATNELQLDEIIDEDLCVNEYKLIAVESEMIVKHGEFLSVPFHISKTNDTENNSTKESYYYRFKSEKLGEHIIPIILEKNGTEMTTTIYVFSTNDFDYISPDSISSAKRIYFKKQLENGLLQREQYNEIVFGDYIEIIDKSYDVSREKTSRKNVLLSDSITISGSVFYQDRSLNDIPAHHLTINIYEYSGIYFYIGETTTNDDGYFSFTFQDYHDQKWHDLHIGYNIKIIIEFEYEEYSVQDFIFQYNSIIDYGEDIELGTTKNKNIYYLYGTEINDAMHYFQAGVIGFMHLEDVSGDTSFETLKTVYPFPLIENSFYNSVLNTICIEADNGHSKLAFSYPTDWDTLLHEFGHYVAEQYGLTSLLAYEHRFDENLSTLYGKGYGAMLSWQEGFATYFSISSQMSYSHIINVPYAGDTNYKLYNIETNNYWLYGEHNEWVIARFLYDLEDGVGEELTCNTGLIVHDLIELGASYLFSLLRYSAFFSTYHTLDEFMDYTSNFLSSNIGDLLSYYNISATPIMPIDVVTKSSPPTFSFTTGGDSTLYSNNSFNLQIWTETGELALFVDLGNSNEYTLNSLSWDSILDKESSVYYWEIIACQTTSFVTGPYKSAMMTFMRPEATPISIGSTYGYTFSQQINNWYEFQVNTSGFYTIETTGSFDTFGDLSMRIIADNVSHDVIITDDDSGSDLNFKMRIYLFSGEKYYLRISSKYPNETDMYGINIQKVPSC